jgi:hypothetical protein
LITPQQVMPRRKESSVFYRSAPSQPRQGTLPIGGENPAAFGPVDDKQRGYIPQLLPAMLDILAAELGLSSSAKDALAWLVMWVTPQRLEHNWSTLDVAGYLGMGRNRAAAVLEELNAATLISWQPPTGGRYTGKLVVPRAVCDLLTAQGRRDAGRYVPIRPRPLWDWCEARRLPFDSRSLLLRLLLATHDQTRIVATTLTELASAMAVNRRRAACLEVELMGALRRGRDGFEVVVYRELVAVGSKVPPRDPTRLTSPFTSQAANTCSTPRDPTRLTSLFAESDDFEPSPADPTGLTARSDAAGARSDAAGARSDAADQPVCRQPINQLTNYFLSATDNSGGAVPVDAGEGRKEEVHRSNGERIFADLVAVLPDQHDLLSGHNVASRRLLVDLLASCHAAGWTSAELVDCLASPVVGARSVMAVVLSQARVLPALPPSVEREAATELAVAELSATRLDNARRYGRNRVGVVSAVELEEDLVLRFTDRCLIDAARTSFVEYSSPRRKPAAFEPLGSQADHLKAMAG